MLKVKVKVKGQRSRDTGTFVISLKSLLLPENGWIATKLAHRGPHKGLHPGCDQGQGQGQRSKVTRYGHFLFHENRFFSQANGWNTTKVAHNCHLRCAQGQVEVKDYGNTGTSAMS